MTKEARQNIYPFINQLQNLKSCSITNPHTGLPVILLTIVTLSQFNLILNFLCSLRQIKLNSKFLVLVTTEPQCYKVFKENNIPIYLLDLSTCKLNYNDFTKLKIILCYIFLKMNYEVLFTDIDIEYFGSIEEYLLCPRSFDVGFWFEGRDSIVPPNSKYFYYVNGGFLRLFPTKPSFSFFELWMKNNLKFPTKHDQLTLHVFMKKSSGVVSCLPFKIDHSVEVNKNGYWSCRPRNRPTFIWHIFHERDLLFACDFILNSQRLVNYKSEKVVPKIFHLTCLKGEKGKIEYLVKAHLMFYSPLEKKCIGGDAVKRWEELFSRNESSLTKQSPQFSMDSFANYNASNAKYIVIDDVIKMFA